MKKEKRRINLCGFHSMSKETKKREEDKYKEKK